MFSPKGGLGVTTLSLTMTLALRKLHGPRVVLVEGDLMFGNLAPMIGLRPDRSILNILDKPKPWTPNLISHAILHHPVLNIDVVLAPPDSHLSEKVKVKDFASFLDTLQSGYDFVFVDVAKRVGDLELEVFERASAIYMVTAPSPVAVQAARKAVNLFTLLRDPIKKLGVISNTAPAAVDELDDRASEGGMGVEMVASIPRGKGDELRYNALKTLEPFAPWGEAQKAICRFARDLRTSLTTGKPAPGVRARSKPKPASFDPFLAVAGEDLSKPPGRSPPRIERDLAVSAPKPTPKIQPPPPVKPRIPTPTGSIPRLSLNSPVPSPSPRSPSEVSGVSGVSGVSNISEVSGVSGVSPAPGSPVPEEAPAETPKKSLRQTLSERLRISRRVRKVEATGASKSASAEASPPRVDARAVKVEGKIGMLVADDNSGFRTGLVRALGYEDQIQVLGEAGNGKDLLDLATIHRPEVILLDANMPEMDGLTAAKELQRRHPNILVLMMSIQGEEPFVEECYKHGVKRFFLKPFEPDQVAQAVEDLFPEKK